MRNSRNLERSETLASWRADDAETGAAVGLVTNLTVEGLQLHSKHSFRRGKELSVQLKVDPKMAGTDHIPLVIKNVWCNTSGVPGLYHAGFSIIDASDTARQSLSNLMDAFSYTVSEDSGNYLGAGGMKPLESRRGGRLRGGVRSNRGRSGPWAK